MSLTEVIHRNEVTSLLLLQGYNVYLPVVDQGIDFIVHREADNDMKCVQQKSRWTIHRKYLDRGIWIAFRDRQDWYLVEHDHMVDLCQKHGTELETRSWQRDGSYTRAHLSAKYKTLYADFHIGTI
ncbi:hypothetical protein [Roseobacter sp. EG26]|uniref:hypothetical protein n=1 Tax=Roseobacter sp. EG26 TaxID=3412477 RepID=UPI003CE52FA6